MDQSSNNVESLYEKMLDNMMADSRPADIITHSVFSGKDGFVRMLRYLKFEQYGDFDNPKFKLKIPDMKRDILIYILTSIRHIANIGIKSDIAKRGPIYKEMIALGMEHLCHSVKAHVNEENGVLYTLELRHLDTETSRQLTAILFGI